MSAPLKTRWIKPIGKREVEFFDDRAIAISGVSTAVLDVYPPSPRGEALGARRLTAGVALVVAGDALSLYPADVLAIECGQMEFIDEADWARAEEAITDAGRAALARQP